MVSDVINYSGLSASNEEDNVVTISGSTTFNIDNVTSSKYEPESPTIDSLYFSKSVKIPDIYPGDYKNVYVKTDLPEMCEEKEYNTDLRCWWTRREN
jgi:hypothetical protein